MLWYINDEKTRYPSKPYLLVRTFTSSNIQMIVLDDYMTLSKWISYLFEKRISFVTVSLEILYKLDNIAFWHSHTWLFIK
jgi:hypothetical protein